MLSVSLRTGQPTHGGISFCQSRVTVGAVAHTAPLGSRQTRRRGEPFYSSSSPGSRARPVSIRLRTCAARPRRRSAGTPATSSRRICAIAGACSSSGPFAIGRLQPITRPSRSIRQWAMPSMCSANTHGLGDGSCDRPCIGRFCGTCGAYASTIACVRPGRKPQCHPQGAAPPARCLAISAQVDRPQAF